MDCQKRTCTSASLQPNIFGPAPSFQGDDSSFSGFAAIDMTTAANPNSARLDHAIDKMDQSAMQNQTSNLCRAMARSLKLPAKPLPARLMPAVMPAVVLLSCLFVLLPTVHAQAPQKKEVRQLIEQLSQIDFDQRESAEQRLIKIGSPAVDSLISTLLDCSPDVCSRVKRILKTIAVEGECDEESLFKVLAALRIRFEVSPQRIKPLLDRWAIQNRAAVVQRWRQQGAIVDDPFEYIDPANEIENEIRIQIAQQKDFQFEIIDNTDVIRAQSKESVPADDAPDEQVSTQPVAEQLKLVLQKSLEENKEFILSSKEGAAGFEKSMSVLQEKPVSVVIGKDWQGEYSELNYTGSRSSLPIISLDVQQKELTDSLLSVIRKHPLKSLILDECSVAADVKETLPASLSLLVIKGSDSPIKLLDLISIDSTALNRVRFVSSKFGKAQTLALKEFPRLMIIELVGIDLEQDVFDGLASLDQLRRVTLERCKFPATAFLKFKKDRSDAMIDFISAKAFLGVGRDSANLAFGRQAAADGCPIATVVPGEAADRAGMKPGDIVLSIGEQKVNDFEELRIAIAQCEIGEEVVIKIRRGKEEMTLRAKMGVPENSK